MKHISFDESTVMREFARIAGEQGLVKVAADIPMPRGEITNAPQGQSRTIPEIQTPGLGPAFENDMKKFPAIMAAANGQVNAAAVVKELAPFLRAARAWMTSQDVNSKKKMMMLGGKLVPILSQLMKMKVMQAKKMGANPNQEELQMLQDAMVMLSQKAAASVEDNGTVKQADGKLYDVSGETGEQLVDKAHPGGGTKTELTHSKTDENLVETIVEQQEADLEVARSVPKGTYAELKTLYTVLSKMGYTKHLSELETLLTITASPEEVMEETLTSLADGLDRLGYAKYADQVDDLLKKKV